MMRLHGGGPNRYYLCPECRAIREDIYRDGAIVAHRWHDEPNESLPKSVREEAQKTLKTPKGDQLKLWG